MSRARTTVLAALCVATALTATACSSGSGSNSGSSSAHKALCPSGTGSGKITVGAFNFGESTILADVYSQALSACGFSTTVKSVGNRQVVEPALEKGDLDVVPEYAASSADFINREINGANAPSIASGDIAKTMEALTSVAAQRGLVPLKASDATDKNAFAVTKKFADANNLKTLSDLAAYSKDHPLVLGGPPECPENTFCEPGLEKTYGIQFSKFKSLDAGGPLTIKGISDGTVDVGLVFTSNPAVGANDLVILDDDKNLQASDNVVPLVNKKSDSPALTETLNSVSAKLTTDGLIAMNKAVSVDRKDAKDVAKSWLKDNGLLG